MSKKHEKYGVESIGLFGLQTEFKLCHIPFLVADDVYGALALEGSSGTGKTTLVKRIGKLNEILHGGKVGIFSADKARYEDFIGVPIPEVESGSMKIYPMPNSVAEMETVLIDEINRATYDNQEKWLSLIATRQIDSINVKCKYLYTAMNPILSESSDTYEGVQPLDKALGERMYALITMPAFGKLDTQFRHDIMRASLEQVNWKPTDEVVELHRDYIQRARDVYNEYKTTLLDRIVEYVDAVQYDLRKESRAAVAIEARRAQYMVTNILAVASLDSVYNTSPIDVSALNALLISFPNRLWEQVVNLEALKMAHERSKNILKTSETQRRNTITTFSTLDRLVEEIKANANNKVTKEVMSKIIAQNIPVLEDDPVSHYIYCISAAHGLSCNFETTTTQKKQSIVKPQEYGKIEKAYNAVISSKIFKDYQKAGEDSVKNNEIPATFKIPDYILMDTGSEQISEIFKSILDIDIGQLSLAVCDLAKIELDSVSDVMVVMDKLTVATEIFKFVKEAYE